MRPLEPDSAEMRALADRAAAFASDFVSGLDEAPAADLDGALDLARTFVEPAPEDGSDFASLLQRIEAGAAKAFNTAGPGYLAFIPGGGLYASAIADFLACVTNRFVNLWSPAPVFAQIEATTLRWLCDLFEFPPEARGVFTSGGSTANLIAVVAARANILGETFSDGVAYVSDQVHASVVRATSIAGIPAHRVRRVPCTSDLAMDVDALHRLIALDRAAGARPFLVVGSAGTTNTGAIDPLDEIAEICARDGLWFHADAAYGGFFQLTERGRARLRGIERADTITLDPHKTLFVPYGTGSLLARDGRRITAALGSDAHYLQDLAAEQEIPNFTDYSPELSRDFRGLRVWLPLKMYGFGAFREQLDEKLDLALHFYEELRRVPGFEVPGPPELTIVPFRYVPENGDADEFNRRLLDQVNASQRVFLSSTVVDGHFTLRVCIVSFRTHRDRIDEALEIIQRSVKEVA